MFGRFVGGPELIIVLVIVILLFGVGRISKISGELGSSIRKFREGLKGEEKPKSGEEEDQKEKEKE